MIPLFTKWYAFPALAVAVVSVATALRNHASYARLRRDTHLRIVCDAESVVAGVQRMAANATTNKGVGAVSKETVTIYLNTLQRSVLVPRRRLSAAARELPHLFDCYALTCVSNDVPDALRVDVWNCLCAVVEESLRAYRDADALSADSATAAASLAMRELLQRRYHINRFLSLNSRMQLRAHALSPSLFAEASRKNAADGSTLRSLVVFARLLRVSCTVAERVLLGALVVASVTHLSRQLMSTGPLATPPKMAYAVKMLRNVSANADGACTSWRSAFCRLLEAVPGRVLTDVMVGSLVSHLFNAAQDAASDELLRRVRAAIKTDTVLALVRFDFVADAAWRVPHRVYSALSDATNFSLGDVDRLLHVFADGAKRCSTICRAPLPCVAGWIARQGVHFLQRQWTRACLMSSYVDAYLGDPRVAPDSCSGRRSGKGNCAPVPQWRPSQQGEREPLLQSAVCHHGLQLLLFTAAKASRCTSATVWEVLALHTRWPLAPGVSLRATQYTLKSLSQAGNAALATKHTAVQALSSNVATNVDTHSLFGSSFATLLGVLRSQGDEWRHSPDPLSSIVCGPISLSPTSSTGEEVMNKLLNGLEGLPLMSALAVRSIPSTMTARTTVATGTEDPANEMFDVTFQVTRAVEGGDLFVLPPVRPFSSASAFQFDVEAAQLRYQEYEGCAQSIAAILYVQQEHCATLDHGAPQPYSLAPTWRVTFDCVSFRYPGTDVDVLHDVSFDVAPGGFLGVVGFSGSGKTTLLLLLSRVYAPTSGQIYINGCPIDRLPARALRRRVGATWQGDGQARFLDGLSVERNIAYGGLHRASDDTIVQALMEACVGDVVRARPHGMREVLQSCEWSGGELERLSVARALMVAPDDAGVYLFDECTSGLDALTEMRVFASGLRAHHHRATQIMVSHRLSSVQDADEIIVMAHGRVVERGSWATLLAQEESSLFRTLYKAQSID
jgi:ABC-type multidrug transport system fused ATPase/permease subunit